MCSWCYPHSPAKDTFTYGIVLIGRRANMGVYTIHFSDNRTSWQMIRLDHLFFLSPKVYTLTLELYEVKKVSHHSLYSFVSC